jgi:hypothetical protein
MRLAGLAGNRYASNCTLNILYSVSAALELHGPACLLTVKQLHCRSRHCSSLAFCQQPPHDFVYERPAHIVPLLLAAVAAGEWLHTAQAAAEQQSLQKLIADTFHCSPAAATLAALTE